MGWFVGRSKKMCFCLHLGGELRECLDGNRDGARELLRVFALGVSMGIDPDVLVGVLRGFVESFSSARRELVELATAIIDVRGRGYARTSSGVCIELAERGYAYCVVFGDRAWAVNPEVMAMLRRDLERGYATTEETSRLIREMEEAGALVRAPNGRLYIIGNVIEPKL